MPATFLPAAPDDIVTVSELNRSVKALLEGSIPLLWVSGEISNFTRAASGHWYFTLKDAQAQVRCVMFRHRNSYVDWQPREGDQVEIRAVTTLYEARGDFQLTVEALRRAGLGRLFEAFTRLKEKLEKEGLFAPERKRALPRFPKSLGIITSPAGAALRDVLTTLKRRMPGLSIVIYPTQVQGEAAAGQIVDAFRQAGERSESDLLIVCRGGGSIEDLWPFNEEIVARAMASCPIPIISGVGHETDFTIADFVADRRAPTPTGAAELATPDRAELLRKQQTMQSRLHHLVTRQLENSMQRLDYLSRRLTHPGQKIAQQGQHLAHLGQRLDSALGIMLVRNRQRLEKTAPRLETTMNYRLNDLQRILGQLEGGLTHLNPHAVLERGYCLVLGPDGSLVRNSAQLKEKDKVEMVFAKGRAEATVTASRPK